MADKDKEKVEQVTRIDKDKIDYNTDLEYLLKIVIPEINLKDKVNLHYELIDKLKISNNFHSSLLPKTQELLINVKQIIEENKNKIEIM